MRCPRLFLAPPTLATDHCRPSWHLLSAPGQISQTNIFPVTRKLTHVDVMKLGCCHVLSWQIKQIEFQSTKRINFHSHISLRILIHCFDSEMMFVMTVGCCQAVMMCLIWDSELIFPPTGIQFRHFVFGQLSQTKAQSSDHKTFSLLTFHSLSVYSRWQKIRKLFATSWTIPHLGSSLEKRFDIFSLEVF